MSTTFLDGPAKGANLSLSRSPLFLRVVVDPSGAVDALDLLSDTPRPAEAVHVYRLVEHVGDAIVCSRGRDGGCRHVSIAKYQLHPVQPTDEEARDNDRWAEWCHAQPEAKG
jgi:hypothetical protein